MEILLKIIEALAPVFSIGTFIAVIVLVVKFSRWTATIDTKIHSLENGQRTMRQDIISGNESLRIDIGEANGRIDRYLAKGI